MNITDDERREMLDLIDASMDHVLRSSNPGINKIWLEIYRLIEEAGKERKGPRVTREQIVDLFDALDEDDRSSEPATHRMDITINWLHSIGVEVEDAGEGGNMAGQYDSERTEANGTRLRIVVDRLRAENGRLKKRVEELEKIIRNLVDKVYARPPYPGLADLEIVGNRGPEPTLAKEDLAEARAALDAGREAA